MKQPTRPRTIKQGELSATLRKPPGKRDPHWWWQVVYYEDRKQRPALGSNGKPAHRRGTPAEIRAHLKALQRTGGWRAPIAPKPPTVLSVDHVLRKWLAASKKRRDRGQLAESTYLNYHRIWKKARPLHATPVDALTLGQVEAWVEELSEALAPRSVILCYRTIRIGWNWAQRHDLVLRAFPQPTLPSIDGYVYGHTTPTPEQAEAVLSLLGGWRRIAGEILYSTGARMGEVGSLTWTSWNRTGRTLLLDGKTGPRTLPVEDPLHRILLAWWIRQGQPQVGPLLGVTPSTASSKMRLCLRELGPRANVDGLSPHAFRRLASTELISGGITPKDYEQVMGHGWNVGMRWYASSKRPGVQKAMKLLGRG